mmetsp:Transcript_324/g.289  ORF Transcript_324/g.289 Transcript_324/m.289 type:complete len:84 (-) Transcript_324:83-334(-)
MYIPTYEPMPEQTNSPVDMNIANISELAGPKFGNSSEANLYQNNEKDALSLNSQDRKSYDHKIDNIHIVAKQNRLHDYEAAHE